MGDRYQGGGRRGYGGGYGGDGGGDYRDRDNRRGSYGGGRGVGSGDYRDNRGGGYRDNRGGGYRDNRGGGYRDNRGGGYSGSSRGYRDDRGGDYGDNRGDVRGRGRGYRDGRRGGRGDNHGRGGRDHGGRFGGSGRGGGRPGGGFPKQVTVPRPPPGEAFQVVRFVYDVSGYSFPNHDRSNLVPIKTGRKPHAYTIIYTVQQQEGRPLKPLKHEDREEMLQLVLQQTNNGSLCTSDQTGCVVSNPDHTFALTPKPLNCGTESIRYRGLTVLVTIKEAETPAPEKCNAWLVNAAKSYRGPKFGNIYGFGEQQPFIDRDYPISLLPTLQTAVLWLGMSQHGQASRGGLFLITKVGYTLVHRAMPVADYLSGMRMTERGPYAMSRALKGVRLQLDYAQKRSVLCDAISDMSICQLPEFDFEDSKTGLRKKVSVQEYFRLRYGKDLDPNGYVVVRKKKTNSGYVDEYYPMELLSIAPNQRRKGMTAKERDELPRVTSLLPTESFRMNEKGMVDLRAILNEGDGIKDYGLHLDPEDRGLHQFGATTVDLPRLEFGNGRAESNITSWNWRGRKILRPAFVKSVVITCIGCNPRLVDAIEREFYPSLQRMGRDMGFPMPNAVTMSFATVDRDFLRTIEDHIRSQPGLIIGVIDDESYPHFKAACDLEGIVSAGIKKANCEPSRGKGPRAFSPNYLSNVILKINGKLGGQPTFASKLHEVIPPNTVVIGVDVSHSGVGDIAPSMACITIAVNDNLDDYIAIPFCFEVSANSTGIRAHEIVNMMPQMVLAGMEERMKRNRSSTLPTSYVIFRDGVGEDMYDLVQEQEIQPLQLALSEKCGKPVKVTCLIVTKRHKVRFAMPSKPADRTSDKANPHSGTMVNMGLRGNGRPEFFLYGHEGRLGTSSPCLVTVLQNGMRLSQAQISTMTYYLCFLVARSSCACSLPQPVYYAHLGAFRARKYRNKHQDAFIRAPGLWLL